MAKRGDAQRVPKVRITRPAGRPFQVRYTDPVTRREVRISVGSRSEEAAEQLRQETAAKLLLGHDAAPKVRVRGPDMPWSDFRDEYSRLRLSRLRGGSNTDIRLDVCERIIKPRRLADMAKAGNLELLKAELLAGMGNKPRKPKDGEKPSLPKRRTPHTVNGYLRVLVAALNWANKQGWLEHPVRKQTVEADDPDKGRPICAEEFERMLAACEKVCPHDTESWRYLLRGLWESGLRVSEALNLSFDVSGTIQVVRERRGVVLKIPGRRQKNRRHQVVPTTPLFAALLDEHPTGTGYVFNPTRRDGRASKQRLVVRKVSSIISMIGEKARVVVNDDGKPASAHDLRRSFGQRLADAGVSPRDLQKIMRHRRLETTEQYYLRDNALEIGDRIAKRLGEDVPGYTSEIASPEDEPKRP